MVGLLIALMATVLILRSFTGAEGMKRNVTGLADAQQTGRFALITLERAIANAGYGLAANARLLAICPDTGDIRTTLRPVSVLIAPGGRADRPDSIVVNYAAAPTQALATTLAQDAPAGTPLYVHSPLGIAGGDLVVIASPTGQCRQASVSSATTPDSNGVVELTPSVEAGIAYPIDSRLIDLGPQSQAARIRYDISDTNLRSLDLYTDGAVANPLASDIVNLKAQYGIDADGDGVLDNWVSADNPAWSPAAVLTASVESLARIKAVRIGLIVKSESYDRELTRPFDWVLFDCPATDKTQCPGRLSGSLAAGWRYRVYETAVPLRNIIWNASQ